MNEKAEMFVAQLERVYARYNEYVRKEILSWAGKLSDAALRGVYKNVRESFSNQYGKAPDIANLTEAYREYQKNLAEEFMYKSLPDPEHEDRKRTMSEEEIEEGRQYLSMLLGGMRAGRNPKEIYQEWQEEKE